MLLGPQCEQMLDNRCQCPNAALMDSIFCSLHDKLKAASANTSDKKDIKTDAPTE